MSLKHFLIPLDGTPFSEAVLPIASSLAHATRAELTVCTVRPTPADSAPFLDRAACRLRGTGLTVSTTMRVGDPAEGIVSLATECSVDLILLATYGRAGLERVLLGSVAEQVIEKAEVPVLVLRPGEQERSGLHTIVVPVDGSLGAAVALSTAVPIAQACGARLVLVRATVPLPLWVYDPTLGLDTGPLIDPMWDEDAREAAELYAEKLAARIRRLQVKAVGEGVSGQPGAVIAATAEREDADLIVMSTHARHGPLRAILGSVADDVVRRCHRPVLFVRRTPARAEVVGAHMFAPHTTAHD